MVKYPKRFCYYCNRIIDYKCQQFVKCYKCDTVCHTDCMNAEGDKTPINLKTTKSSRKILKTKVKNKVLPTMPNYLCNKCCLKETPFSAIITNSKGAIKKQFSTTSNKKTDESRKISECIEPAFLNSLFYSTDEKKYGSDSPLDTNQAFSPVPDKYFNANHIELEDYNISLHEEKQFGKSNTFSSVGINMRSLANTKNFAKLQIFVDSLCFEPKIIAINETYLRSDEDGPHCNLENYTFKSNCRKNYKGGGVGLYIHDSLQVKVRKDLNIMEEKVFESFFVETLNLERPIIFGTIYRSPKDENVSSFMHRLDNCLKTIDQSSKSCFIQGDFNFNLIDSNDTDIANFKENMFNYSFYSLINKPTRITDRTATCLDHIWSNDFDDRIISGIITEMIADHMATFQCCNIGFRKKSNSKNKTIREFRKIHFEELEGVLERTDVHHILHCSHVDTAYGHLQSCIDDAIERSSRTCRKGNRDTNKWFDNELVKLRSKRQRLYHKKIKNNTAHNKVAYDEVKKRYEKLIIQKKKSYYQNLIREYNSDMRKTWGVINSLLGKARKKECITSLTIKGTLCDNDQAIADEFNTFFSNVPKKLHNELPKMNHKNRLHKCLQFLKNKKIKSNFTLEKTSVKEVWDFINQLRKKSSTGLDNISPTVLKHFPLNIILCFVHIFNLSLAQGKFINCFKYAKIVPIHKSDSKLEAGNYRPISLLPVASKILEKIVHRRLYSFLSKNHFFNKNQFGFRSNHSTELAASSLINQICGALDGKTKVMSVFLDMSKAFDCVDHDILLEKMSIYGIRGKSLSWFNSYLKGRFQKVMINGVLSENTCAVECGVPQGSILGPLLYLIYINDIDECLHYSKSTLYADDTTLTICGGDYKKLFYLINKDLVSLSHWLGLNMLTLNLSKTKYMVYTSSNRATQPVNLHVAINGVEIERVNEFKFLGIHIDEHLSWKTHMNKLLSKIHRNLGVVRKISCFLNRKTLLQMYHSMIMSHVRYGISVWHHGHIAMRKKIQACANKFLRMIYYMKRRESVKPLMIDNKILSTNQIYYLEVAKVMKRVNLGLIPAPFIDILQNQVRTSTMVTRRASLYYQRFTALEKCKQAISYSGPFVWNTIPVDVKSHAETDLPIVSVESDSAEKNRKKSCFNKFTKCMKKYALENVAFV